MVDESIPADDPLSVIMQISSNPQMKQISGVFYSPARRVAQSILGGIDSFGTAVVASSGDPEAFGQAMLMALMERANDPIDFIRSVLLRGGQ